MLGRSTLLGRLQDRRATWLIVLGLSFDISTIPEEWNTLWGVHPTVPKEGDMTNLAPWVVVIAGIVVLWISLSGQLVSWIALLGIVVGAAAVVLGLRWRRRLVVATKL